ncbi:protein of unknown function DUF303 acetylesterase putative [Fibrella aestuarina BUZ 2]|uniref:Fibronectin type-III domain-containing protein n=1 Tax=Fibrella aestuarina BUZ 2 TaxID=1166018 RepID=I0K6G9_9BACT|nr:protein of unknown function DUF303 acetylesterase putative [Fibrella aestuarina BUZ 2]
MKVCYVALVCWLICQQASYAQRITFFKLPANGQLYPRNEQSVALVPIEGRIDTAGFERVSVQVFRNSSLYRQYSLPLSYSPTGSAPVALTTTIPAELAQYRVRIFLHSGVAGITDSLLIADRQRIVAGDAYVISGQSNATAYNAPPYYTYQSEYIRTFGVYTGFGEYNPADTLWAAGNGSSATLIGTWGMEMARRLTEQYRIPICIINGAAGGAPIQVLSARTDDDPMDLATNYGRLLYRVHKAGLTGRIKAYFYRQGENETSGWASGWMMNFDYLFNNVRRDYPNLRRFYLFQIHVLAGFAEATPGFRDYQRRLQSLQPLIRSHATVGTKAYDGIHFGVEGHQETGLEVFRLVARDFYGSTDTVQIISPDIKKAYYTSPARNELVMQFDEGQQLRWPGDTTVSDPYGDSVTHQLRQWLFLNKKAGAVVSGRVDGYRVILTLNGSRSEQDLGYLPPNYPTQDATQPTLPGFASAFPGPFLKNERGVRAFSFWNVPIGAPLPPLLSLAAKSETDGSVKLTWADHPTEQAYVLERRTSQEQAFSRLAALPLNATLYTDSTAQNQTSYQYRLRAVTTAAEALADVSIAVNCQPGGQLASLQSGDWYRARLWSCGMLPSPTAITQIMPRHVVTLHQHAWTKSIRLSGTLRLQPGGILRMGQ